jgi:mevalonate pyrophosphate decarboxylase
MDSDYLPLVSSNSSCRSLFVPFVLFPLAIVVSVLRYTDSDYLPLVSSNSSSRSLFVPFVLFLLTIIVLSVLY